MEKYLIALDMDGTLLQSDSTINEELKNLLINLGKQGHKVVIASGRPFRAIEKYYEELKLDTPAICYNGAYIFSKDHYFDRYTFAFPRQVIIDIANKISKDYLENIMCETNTDIYLLNHDTKLREFFWHDNMKIHYGKMEEILDSDPMTMIILAKDNKHNDLIKQIVESHPELCFRNWMGKWDFCSEVYFSHVDKCDALKHVAKYYNIDKDHIIAFGDASNDLRMVDYAKWGFIMKNAEPDILKQAKVITKKDNDHNGIVLEINQIISKN